ncbi:MAG TPA: carboxyl transferase domain-containing protein [Spirochaetota bacterium]|nr:carboxyl transferase domain-containing protein [Spirochaetota bacterium]
MNDIDRTELHSRLAGTIDILQEINPHVKNRDANCSNYREENRQGNLRRVLIANRGEIAKRFFLSLHEEGIPSVAVVTDPDKGQSWYDFADEVVFIGGHGNYSDPYIIIAAARMIHANAIYSGYGFLSENPAFVRLIETLNRDIEEKIIFMGPTFSAMHLMGDKANARRIARENSIPLFKSSEIYDSDDILSLKRDAEKIGYPVIIKPVSGGGGKGVVTINSPDEIESAVYSCMRTASDLYSLPSFYIEKLIENPVHIEVQIFNGWVIGIRKCAIQRRNQKLVEESGELFLEPSTCKEMIAIAEKIASLSGYSHDCGAGTIEFLIDQETGKAGFLEMNTRLQVEYAVTDQSLDIDLVKCQIWLYDGRRGELEHLASLNHRVIYKNHAIECRIYAEDPDNNYLPSPGVITELDLPTFNGVRCDFGFKEGDRVLPMYDPMIGKLIVNGKTRSETLIRLERALQELYIKGVKTNIPQLLDIVRHPEFTGGKYNNNLLSENSDFSHFIRKKKSGRDDSRVHIITGAFTEYLRLLNRNVSEFMVIARLKGIVDATIPEICSDFTILCGENSFYVRFLQISLNEYYTFLGEEFTGTITLKFANEQADNIIVNFRDRILRIRVDRKSGSISLRIKNDRNKISYYSMCVYADGTAGRNQTEVIRSPFQGTIVSICKNFKTDDMVWEGEPLIILSSMKMETTINSPVDGKISYIIGDRDNPEKFRSGSHDSPLHGRSIQEGEILIKIEKGYDVYNRSEIRTVSDNSSEFFNRYFNRKFITDIIKSPEENSSVISGLLLSLFRGYLSQPAIIDMLQRIISEISIEKWKSLINDYFTEPADMASELALLIKNIFSQRITGEGISLYDEFSTFISEPAGRDLLLSDRFNSLLEKILRSYDPSGRLIPELKNGDILSDKIFLFIRSAYQNFTDYPGFFRNIIHMLPCTKLTEERIAEITDLCIRIEHDEPTLLTAEKIKNSISEYREIPSSMRFPSNEREIGGKEHNGINNIFFKKSRKVHRWHLDRIQFLEKDHEIECLDSSIPCLPVYSISSYSDHKSSCIACCLIDGDKVSAEELYEIIRSGTECALSLLCRYRAPVFDKRQWVHIIITENIISFDGSSSEGSLTFNRLRDMLSSVSGVMNGPEGFSGIIECNTCLNRNDIPRNRQIRFYTEAGRVLFEFISASDSRSPYSITDETGKNNQRLFDINKWPVELWAEECFDHGSREEIKIRTIDYDLPGHKEAKPVGAKIFRGEIQGTPACFFMKDSRINSGSTGDLEGMKYVAASYLSIMTGMPLYVWNDGAGANIREGLVALNRGAEGFMMNALQTGFTADRFRSFIKHNPDPDLISLFYSINEQFGFTSDSPANDIRPLTLVAIGTGSSAGLDVYGSSQAVLQIMLDSEHSYRVLTGSGVIKSIIGEDISNYEIGGAKRICRMAGVADILAEDKLHLVYLIRQIHDFFYGRAAPAFNEEEKSLSRKGEEDNNAAIVLNENIIRRNVAHRELIELKRDWYESDSLTGGLAKLGGERAMIIGARTDNGLITEASVIKARELLRIARRTSSHEIIVFGREFIREMSGKEFRLSCRIDFMNTLQSGKNLRIHIITHIDGLKLYYINNTADIIILVGKDRDRIAISPLIRNNTTFSCSTIDEAFDLSRRLLALISGNKTGDITVSEKIPSIPENPSIPFDMVTSVIEPVFDSGSFMEFYREMNNPETGPMLITGIATLNGTTTGIIADHPLRKGGAADAYGTEKFRIFTELLNRRKLPLIMLSNSSGFMPGSKQETLRIQAVGAESIDANILGDIPVVSVVFNQNYGGRLIQAFNKFLRPGIVYLTLPDSILAVIGARVAFDLLSRKEYNRLIGEGDMKGAEEIKSEFLRDYLERAKGDSDGIKSGLVDWIITDIRDLRTHLIKGLETAKKRCDEAFNSQNASFIRK